MTNHVLLSKVISRQLIVLDFRSRGPRGVYSWLQAVIQNCIYAPSNCFLAARVMEKTTCFQKGIAKVFTSPRNLDILLNYTVLVSKHLTGLAVVCPKTSSLLGLFAQTCSSHVKMINNKRSN